MVELLVLGFCISLFCSATSLCVSGAKVSLETKNQKDEAAYKIWDKCCLTVDMSCEIWTFLQVFEVDSNYNDF